MSFTVELIWLYFFVMIAGMEGTLACVSTTHSGKEFVFGISQNGILSLVEPRIFIYVINPNPESVDISIVLPNVPNTDPFPIQATLVPYERKVYMTMQSTLAPTGSSVNDRGVRVDASSDVMVQVSNNGYLTSDGFMVYPLDTLDKRYMVVSYKESASVYPSGMSVYQGPYQVLVTAAHDHTLVTLHFQFCSDSRHVVVTYNNQDYTCGDQLLQTLNAYQNLQIQSSSDLSGTLVVSDKPVAVFSGVYWGSIGSAGYPDHMVDALLPIASLGRTYLVPSAQIGDGYILRIIGTADSTHVDVTYNDGHVDSFDLQISESWTSTIPREKFAHVESTHPILAVQLTMYNSPNQLSDPAITVLQPVCQSSPKSIAVVSLPYYLTGSGIAKPVPSLDITVIVAKRGLPNVRVYTMVEGEGYEDDCSNFDIQESQYFNYSVIHVPFTGNKKTLIYGRYQEDIYVYTRGISSMESYSSVAGYWANSILSIELQSVYCGEIQTTPPTTTEELTTTRESTVQESTYISKPVTLEATTTEMIEETTENESTVISKPVTLELTTTEMVEEATENESTFTSKPVTLEISTTETVKEPTKHASNLMFETSTSDSAYSPMLTKTSSRETTEGTPRIVYKFKPYVIPDLDDIRKPVESPISKVLGGGCCLLVLIFVAAIILIDLSHLVAHFHMFLRNIKSMWHFIARKKSQKRGKGSEY